MALAWYFADERDASVIAIGERVAAEGAVVPALFWMEITNVLVSAARARRLKAHAVSGVLDTYFALPLITDDIPATQAVAQALPFAQAHRLTIYDALYLELATRRKARLATRDRDLLRAATKLGVSA